MDCPTMDCPTLITYPAVQHMCMCACTSIFPGVRICEKTGASAASRTETFHLMHCPECYTALDHGNLPRKTYKSRCHPHLEWMPAASAR